MKFIVSILLIALSSFAACLYLPWWSIAIVAFLVTVIIYQAPGKAFLSGFLALFVIWVVIASWISYSNENILATRLSLVILKSDNPVPLILLTGVLGGLVAGFAAMAGSYLRGKKRLALTN